MLYFTPKPRSGLFLEQWLKNNNLQIQRKIKNS